MERKSGLREDFEYLPDGLLKCAISAGMRYSYEYDMMGRLARKSASGRTLLALGYDKNGNRVKQTDVTGKTTEYRFDPLDFLAEVYDNEKRLAEYRYTPGGQLQSLSHGPVRMAYNWDADQNLTALMAHTGSELLVDNHYSYDGNRNRTEKRQKEGATWYTYDGLNQLTKIEYPTLTEELFYDRSGNRTRRLSGGEEERYSYDPRNWLYDSCPWLPLSPSSVVVCAPAGVNAATLLS